MIEYCYFKLELIRVCLLDVDGSLDFYLTSPLVFDCIKENVEQDLLEPPFIEVKSWVTALDKLIVGYDF